jgi:predicted ATP-binding protein involved in virulence
MRRLVSINIEGLLGRFSPKVRIPEEWEFVIIHGPNGVGKTRLLEIIENTFRFRPHVLANIPFASATFMFDDGAQLEVDREVIAPQSFGIGDEPDTDDPEPLLEFRLKGVSNDVIRWSLKRQSLRISPVRLREMERFLPVERLGGDQWLDHPSGEVVTLEDIAERYSDAFPFESGPPLDVPEAIREFLGEVEVHLIETQRLLRYDRASKVQTRQSPSAQRATVQQFAEDLTRRIAEALAQNSRISQQLDRTFPRRILAESIPIEVSDDDIRRRYEEQSRLRTSLSDIAVLDASGDLPLPQRDLEAWERGVLWTYLDDTETKLATFRDLLDRVTLIREIINSRFLFKELRIDPEKGFRFVTNEGLDVYSQNLSSGEQHELVLLYDLLFNVRRGSIVLVDEPEISLHIAWQQQFLNDIQRIASLSDLQFIIATHSPQIIHTWSARAIPLAPADLMLAEFGEDLGGA